MRPLIYLLMGACLGYGLATRIPATVEKQVVRRDAVTLNKGELAHLARAIQLVKDKPAQPEYWRYEADSLEIAFECPTAERCNLEVPARKVSRPRELRLTSQVEAVTTTQATLPKREQVLQDAGPPPGYVPHVENGVHVGWSKPDLQPGSVYQQLEIKNADIVTAPYHPEETTASQ